MGEDKYQEYDDIGFPAGYVRRIRRNKPMGPEKRFKRFGEYRIEIASVRIVLYHPKCSGGDEFITVHCEGGVTMPLLGDACQAFLAWLKENTEDS